MEVLISHVAHFVLTQSTLEILGLGQPLAKMRH